MLRKLCPPNTPIALPPSREFPKTIDILPAMDYLAGEFSFSGIILFDFPFHLVNLLLSQVGDFFETGDAEGFPLCFPPAG